MTQRLDDHQRNELTGFAKSGLVTLGGSILAAASGLILTVVVARLLGAAMAGVFFIVVAIFTILSEITELGADTGLVRTAAALKATGRSGEIRAVAHAAFWPVLGVGVVTAAAVYLLAPQAATLFADPGQQGVTVMFIQLAAPFLAVSAARSVALSGMRGLGSLTAYTLINVAMPVSRPLLALAVVAAGYGGAAVMLAWSVPVGITFVIALIVMWRLVRRQSHGETAPAGPAIRELWSFSSTRGVAAVVEIGIVWLDVLIVGALVSNHDAGIYATASRFITSGTLVLAATRIAVAPQISALLAKKDHGTAEELNTTATGWVVVASWPLYLALAVFGPFILTLFGKEFTGGATALAVLASTMLVVMAAGNVQTILLMGGKSTWSLANKSAALITNVLLNLVLVPRIGILGAALAWAAAMLVDTLAAAVQVRRFMGLRLGLRGLAVPALWAVAWFGVMGVAIRLTMGATPAAFLLYLVLACAGYGLLVWRLRARLRLHVLLDTVRRRTT